MLLQLPRNVIIPLLLSFAFINGEDRNTYGHFTNDFIVELDTTDVGVARQVAANHGFTLRTKLETLADNMYHFVHEEVSKRSKRSALSILQRLHGDTNVKNVDQQSVLHRVKRDTGNHIIHDKQLEMPEIINVDKKAIYEKLKKNRKQLQAQRAASGKQHKHIFFNDPYFDEQWYLVNWGQSGGISGYDVNVERVWQKNITGSGVVVCILDDGIDHTHPDLAPNYDAEASWDFNDFADLSHDPTPDKTDSSNSHGTRCAGEVAAVANNSNCIVGIAYNAKIGGVRMLDGAVTDLIEAQSLSFNSQHIDIYSSSWGPADDGKTMLSPGKYARIAFEKGVKEGRKGKGSIFVWATGNGGAYEDDCSCDGYVARIESISIGCINDKGLSTYFTEICPSTMAVIFTGGDNIQPSAYSHDDSNQLKVATTDINGGCTLSFEGTSSASPLAAGGFALVLQANPDLTWRDIQQLIVETARIPNSDEPGWKQNGANFHVNSKFGFGALDIGMMVEKAQNWKLIGPQIKCNLLEKNDIIEFSPGNSGKQSIEFKQGDCIESGFTLEHVRLHMRLQHDRRGNISISLISPMQTSTVILKPRNRDSSRDGIDFTFMSVHTWGENPIGKWEIIITDISPLGTDGGILEMWSLQLYGKVENHKVNKAIRSSEKEDEAHKLNENEVKTVIKIEAKLSDNAVISGSGNLPTDAVHRHNGGGEYKKRTLNEKGNENLNHKTDLHRNKKYQNLLLKLKKMLSDKYQYKKRSNTKNVGKIEAKIKRIIKYLKRSNY